MYDDLTAELSLLRVTASLSLFCLDCMQVNQDLVSRSKKIRERLVEFEVNENRDINRKFVYITILLASIRCFSTDSGRSTTLQTEASFCALSADLLVALNYQQCHKLFCMQTVTEL